MHGALESTCKRARYILLDVASLTTVRQVDMSCGMIFMAISPNVSTLPCLTVIRGRKPNKTLWLFQSSKVELFLPSLDLGGATAAFRMRYRTFRVRSAWRTGWLWG